jgi:hypothetical protein
MTLAWKVVGALLAVMGTISFPVLLFGNQGFRTLYWNLVGQNGEYAAVGAIATFAFIIALSSLLWNKQ